ncbi:hypothetical protein [Sphingomonas sp. TDK1]|uniref:hypothetical protein n=1 Tax=Sphingomonas sp. TDK1 TaxID=453247 RepID=UPI000B1BEF90|nr:hypothetical protein [Sphingomonas sp. TDK1]
MFYDGGVLDPRFVKVRILEEQAAKPKGCSEASERYDPHHGATDVCHIDPTRGTDSFQHIASPGHGSCDLFGTTRMRMVP